MFAESGVEHGWVNRDGELSSRPQPRYSTRRATAADIPALVRLINLAYRVEAFFVKGDRTNAEDVAERISTPNSCFLVIDGAEPGDLAGAVYVDMHDARGHFALLSVDPKLQGKGLGHALVDAAAEYCRDAGCKFIDLEVVNLREELPAFYTAMGFEAFGTAPFPEPGKLSQDAYLVLMTRRLDTAPGDAREPRVSRTPIRR